MQGMWGRGVRVVALVGVSLLAGGVATAAAAVGVVEPPVPGAVEVTTVPTAEPLSAGAEPGTGESGAAEPGTAESGTAESGTAESGTVESRTAESGTPEFGTADPSETVDPAGNAASSGADTPMSEPPMVGSTWYAVVLGETRIVDWSELASQLYPDAGPWTLVGVSQPEVGTMAVDLTTGIVSYTAPDAMPEISGAFTITVRDASGQELEIVCSLDLFRPTVAGTTTQVTAAGVPITFGYVPVDQRPIPDLTIASAIPDAAVDDTRPRELAALTSYLPDRFVAVGPIDPAQGTALLDTATDQVTFTPATGFIGAAEFSATVGGPGGEATETIRVDVLHPLSDTTLRLTTSEAAAVDIDAVTAAGGADRAFAGDWSAAQHGTLAMALPLHGLRYTPDPGFTGVDTLTVTVADDAGQSATVTVRVQVGELARTGVPAGSVLSAAGGTLLLGLGLVVLRRRTATA